MYPRDCFPLFPPSLAFSFCAHFSLILGWENLSLRCSVSWGPSPWPHGVSWGLSSPWLDISLCWTFLLCLGTDLKLAVAPPTPPALALVGLTRRLGYMSIARVCFSRSLNQMMCPLWYFCRVETLMASIEVPWWQTTNCIWKSPLFPLAFFFNQGNNLEYYIAQFIFKSENLLFEPHACHRETKSIHVFIPQCSLSCSFMWINNYCS